MDWHWGDMLIKYDKWLYYHNIGAMPSFEYYDVSPRLWYHPNIAPRKKCYLGYTLQSSTTISGGNWRNIQTRREYITHAIYLSTVYREQCPYEFSVYSDITHCKSRFVGIHCISIPERFISKVRRITVSWTRVVRRTMHCSEVMFRFLFKINIDSTCWNFSAMKAYKLNNNYTCWLL